MHIIINKTFDVNVDPLGISLSNFELIQDGMTLDEIAALLGSEGTVSSAAENLETRSWRSNAMGGLRIIVISFRDGQVTGKSQSGL